MVAMYAGIGDFEICSSVTPDRRIHRFPMTGREYQTKPTSMLDSVASRTAQMLMAGTVMSRPYRSGPAGPAGNSAPERSDGEADGAHHLAAVVGDPLRTPRRHPHPVDAEPVAVPVERLSRLLLDDVGQRAAGRGERHRDEQGVVLVVPVEVVDEAEVDDVDAELGVDDVLQSLGDLIEALRRERDGGHQSTTVSGRKRS